MKTIDTWVKKITFEMKHPSHEENRLVRTLVVSDTVYVPEGFPAPTHAELGFVDFDYRDEKDWPLLRGLIVAEVIRSKIDGLSPSGVSEVMRTVNESEFKIIATSSHRQNANWYARYAIQITMPDEPNKPYWFDPKAKKLIVHTRSHFSGVGDPYFQDNCIWVSRMVAANKAKEILDEWQKFGLPVQPVAAEVREVCYAVQQIQLVTEFQRDSLYSSICAFTPYRSAEMA